MFKKILFIIIFIFISQSLLAKKDRIIIASTTSTYDTGLLNYINKEFEKNHDIKIHVLALGTGQAIINAKQGNADILLVHHEPSEIKFMKEGYGIERYNLMYNDFILVGPKINNDKCTSINQFLLNIINNKYLFISRGDKSGTHLKEKDIWNKLGFSPELFSSWYKKVGQGMGATLTISNELNGFTLTDRSTWISFNKKENLKIICENMQPIINQYSIIAVNPKLNTNTKSTWVKKYIKWIISDEGKKLINEFKIKNKQMFFFNHH